MENRLGRLFGGTFGENHVPDPNAASDPSAASDPNAASDPSAASDPNAASDPSAAHFTRFRLSSTCLPTANNALRHPTFF